MIVIAIPIYLANDLHLDFTLQTIRSIQTKDPYRLVIVDNFSTPELKKKLQDEIKIEYTWVDNPENNVSKAWNLGIFDAKINNCEYILIPNNDIIFHEQAIDNLLAFAKTHDEFVIWTANQHGDFRTLQQAEIGTSFDEHPNFSCFMLSRSGMMNLYEKEKNTGEPYPGLFDENFHKAYFEDNDMHTRILRAGLKAGKTASALFYHYGSRTIKSDDDLDAQNRVSYELNRQYFIRKWGWDPHGTVLANDDPKRFAYELPFIKEKYGI